MKNILLLIIISIMYMSNLYSQCDRSNVLVYQTMADFRLDTTTFVHYNFVERADCYVGKTFRELLSDLDMKPIIMGIGYSFGEEGKRLFSGIRLYIPSASDNRCYIHVTWAESKIMPLDAETLLRRNGMHKWLDDYAIIFADNEIGHIVTNFSKKSD